MSRRWQAHLAVALTFTVTALSSARVEAGYTHYWTWHQTPDPAAMKECIADMRRLVEARRAMLEVDGSPGESSPERLIDINGIDDDAHEPFIFPGRTGFNLCKTQWKPYDVVVTACLLAAADHFPPDVLEIASDGNWKSGDWKAGAALYHSVLQRPVRNPLHPRATRRDEDDGDDGDGGVQLPTGLPPLPTLPAGDRARNLAISVGVLMVLVALFFGLPRITLGMRYDFVVRIRDDRVTVNGRVSRHIRERLRQFFEEDFPSKPHLRVVGRFRADRTIELHFIGPASPGEQQRVRNFLAMNVAG